VDLFGDHVSQCTSKNFGHFLLRNKVVFALKYSILSHLTDLTSFICELYGQKHAFTNAKQANNMNKTQNTHRFMMADANYLQNPDFCLRMKL
jgi:hypothetical protein